MILTCRVCAHQEHLTEETDGMKPGKSYERWCTPCRRTTSQFAGIDAAKQIAINASTLQLARKTGR